MRKTLEERFWEKVDRRGDQDCWEWQARTVGSTTRYGDMMVEGHHMLAHRISYKLSRGVELLPGQQVLHTCDNGLCCNPRHLFLGTHTDNMRDKVSKGRATGGGGKLDTAKAYDILGLYYDQHLSQRVIAEMYRVTIPMISMLVNGYHWLSAYEQFWSDRGIKAA